jgi:hypothetical protein
LAEHADRGRGNIGVAPGEWTAGIQGGVCSVRLWGLPLIRRTPKGCKKISRWLASEASVTTGLFSSLLSRHPVGVPGFWAIRKPGVAPLRGLPLANISAPLRGAFSDLPHRRSKELPQLPVTLAHRIAVDFDFVRLNTF